MLSVVPSIVYLMKDQQMPVITVVIIILNPYDFLRMNSSKNGEYTPEIFTSTIVVIESHNVPQIMFHYLDQE